MKPLSADRPRLNLPPTTTDRLLDGLSLALLVFLLVLPAIYYGDLPERIPTHFGLDGQPDDWGNKQTLWLLPLIGLAVAVLLTLVNRMPHNFNYLVRITPENAEQQYRNAMLMIRVLRLLQLLLFLYLSWATIHAALGQTAGLGVGFTLAFVGAISVGMMFFVMRSARLH